MKRAQLFKPEIESHSYRASLFTAPADKIKRCQAAFHSLTVTELVSEIN